MTELLWTSTWLHVIELNHWLLIGRAKKLSRKSKDNLFPDWNSADLSWGEGGRSQDILRQKTKGISFFGLRIIEENELCGESLG